MRMVFAVLVALAGGAAAQGAELSSLPVPIVPSPIMPVQSGDQYLLACVGSSIRIFGFGYGSPSGTYCPILTVKGQSNARDYVSRNYPRGFCHCNGNGQVDEVR